MKIKEIWKDIHDHKDLYRVSNYGQVKSLDRYIGDRWGNKILRKGKILKPFKDRNGYLRVILCVKNKRGNRNVSNLVLDTFYRASKSNEVCQYLDGDKDNVCIDNLMWGKERYLRTQERDARYLTEEKVKEIKRLLAHRVDVSRIGILFCITDKTVMGIKEGRSWKAVKLLTHGVDMKKMGKLLGTTAKIIRMV